MDNEYVENARWSAITAAKQAPDAKFLLFTGDFVETGTEQNSEWEWEQWFEVSMKPLLSRMAFELYISFQYRQGFQRNSDSQTSIRRNYLLIRLWRCFIYGI